ncbi:hypothetical protein GGS20DRAFT_561673, partial [Poronia punctata]
MAKWKELGEVPDSDDESTWDSEECLPDSLLPARQSDTNAAEDAKNLVPVGAKATDEVQSVWDVPQSSQSSAGRDSRPPSPSSDQPRLSTPTKTGTPTRDPREENAAPPASSSEPGDTAKNDAKATTEAPARSNQSAPNSQPDVSRDVEDDAHATRSDDAVPTMTGRPIEVIIETRAPDIGQFIHESSWPMRSLRPRKPIQEHPYLLESVQYSKQWRSRGLRPVRVEVEEQARRRQEEDSQEQDFEDDSQSTSQDIAPEITDESQGTARFAPSLEVDELALSDIGETSPNPNSPIPGGVAAQSSQEDEEFPDPKDLDKWNFKKDRRKIPKRRASPNVSSRRKQPKLGVSTRPVDSLPVLPDISGIFDVPASPPPTSPGVLVTTPMTAVNQLGKKTRTHDVLTPKPSSNISSRSHSPAPVHQNGGVIDLTALEDRDDDDDDLTDALDLDAASKEEEDPDAIRQAARRMRGVLPASWLRLDQQTSIQKKAKSTTRHQSPVLSPERSTRKGVAQRRIITPRAESRPTLFLDDSDDSGDSDATVRLPNRDIPRDIPRHDTIPAFDDDAGSVIEEDQIDRMLPGRRKRSAPPTGPQKRRKRDQQSIFRGQPNERKRQQRITGLISHSKSGSNPQVRRVPLSNEETPTRRTSQKKKGNKRVTTSQPPRLGILDVVEPGAPDFLRVAARTAGKRRDQGRASPSKKLIMLGVRQDAIDVGNVLSHWNQGILQPKKVTRPAAAPQRRHGGPAQTPAQDGVLRAPKAVGDRPTTRPKRSKLFVRPRRMAKQASMRDFIDVGTSHDVESGHDADDFSIATSDTRDPAFRPAQLESAGNATTRHEFAARKKALDALYRQSRKKLPLARTIRLEEYVNRQTVSDNGHSVMTETLLQQQEESRGPTGPSRNKARTRFRKQNHPRAIDVSAPQYSHANDPLPCEPSPSPMVDDMSNGEGTGKLSGLGPYGVHYTQHFEMFPLDAGVFFHQSTLIGSGRLKRALDTKTADGLSHSRGHCTFTIDEMTLHWGSWDDRTSSQLGIVFDWAWDRLDPTSSSTADGRSVTAIQAVDFVLAYLQDHLSFGKTDVHNLFADRLVEVLRSLELRLKEPPSDLSHMTPYWIDALTRILVVTVQTLRLCQGLDQTSAAFQMEDILKGIAAATASILLRNGLDDVRSVYNRLQQASFRDIGIKNDEHTLMCWVTMIRVLEGARIPRASFWEVVSSAVLNPSVDNTCDAAMLERAWRCLFTLLPLGEFDDTGIAISGRRHTMPLEGWTIPQRLLQRVFSLYRSNSRQAPGFNDYLRAVVGRCHYLVEQWGWYKCNAILGTIFDFFAVHDLHNLRNEEVYQSPQFLDQLSESPSLATSPEDRCFHIFLKLIALSVKRLRKVGKTNEVKNLIARLLPNHNRQYNKTMATHETEIAALRNHHDLLCTLFWAAPAEMRPSIQGIEGLVDLSSSHKEACLISLRAWSRLSRFVVSCGGEISAYRPLAEWQRNIFHQVLEQFLSVELEVNRQLLSMSAEACRTITEAHKQAVINGNKKVATELLHYSIKASLDVMRHTATLDDASFVLNSYPLEQIFIRMSFSSAKSEWDILQVALDILDHYLVRVNRCDSSEPLGGESSRHQEDAIMLLERKFASPFISTVRGLVNSQPKETTIVQERGRDRCIEEAVILASRLAACLIHARLARFQQFFRAGSYHLFQHPSEPTMSPSRKYFALFLATMVDGGFVDFKDVGLTPLDLYLAEITKPTAYLAYENRLALGLKKLGEAHLENAVIEVGNTPDYSSNRALFNYSIVSMRKALHRADAGQKALLQNGFSKALRLV